MYTAGVNYSRRDLSLLLPLLAGRRRSAENPALPSKTFRFEDIPVRANGENKSRALFRGKTHSGYDLEMHMTELAPGLAPHPPHHHVHEEAIFIHQGTLEVTISGKSVKIGPGSVAYVASGEEHGWKNVGTDRALYLVVELGSNDS